MEKHNHLLPKMQAFRTQKKSAKLDFWIGFGIALLGTAVSILLELDVAENLYTLSRNHESWELDEIILLIFWLGIGAIIYSIRRVQDIKSLNNTIAMQAYYDPITHLPNRIMAFEYLSHTLLKASNQNSKLAVMFIDLDNFKVINDTHGHATGDKLILSVSKTINTLLHSKDLLCRIGGDEFLCILDLSQKKDHLNDVLNDIINSQKMPITVSEKRLMVNYSVGVALYPDHGHIASHLVQAADTAMYHVKSSGKGGFQLYTEELGQALRFRREIEEYLRQANFDQELYLVFQPQIDLHRQRIQAYEVLVRWHHSGQDISPNDFISIAEDMGIIRHIDRWVLKKAIEQTQSWLPDDTRLSVNISAVEFNQHDLIPYIKKTLDEYQFSAKKLELEITETALISDFKTVYTKLKELNDLGITIAIDDFGVGHSSLARLKDLPFHKLKIDRSFITEIQSDEKQKSIVKAIVGLAYYLELDTIVEGVESQQQVEILQALGCYVFQGHHFSKPLKSNEALLFSPSKFKNIILKDMPKSRNVIELTKTKRLH
ncbi:putative bifunctional diguanylate cyclase/phosphodiesterase [Marinibactrum halimedae]|uniref:EAL domain-containing protein n=1 Tax=Marinibactrum halimedae TaxID=1444977 RepID=A0AA37TC88_9GAMM|nr:EAL domain-containing protein [Marinibactrum halimedae]MCD9458015.1 EAL domain-containing protein [Marinibactrum halimedae]GLS27641.1 hypothetical protein GCM10007877_33600 [Marinibactrum halimedae]